MTTLVRPRPGGVAAVIAPSAPGWRLSAASERRAARALGDLGLTARPSTGMRARAAGLAVDPQLRLRDLREALEDPGVDVLFAVYGGYSCIDLLAGLPCDLWERVRKPLVGFSDITALSAALWTQIGLPSFHGPNFATLGAPDAHAFTLDSLSAALFQPGTVRLRDPGTIAEDLWFQPPVRRTRDWRGNTWRALRGGRCTGPLLGGNLPTLLALAGTSCFPDLDGAVLLIECDMSNPPGEIDRGLAQLGLLGAFERAAGIVFGSFGQSTDRLVARLVDKHLRAFQGPVLARVNCSHVDPIATLPYGGTVTLDADARVLSFEAPFEDGGGSTGS